MSKPKVVIPAKRVPTHCIGCYPAPKLTECIDCKQPTMCPDCCGCVVYCEQIEGRPPVPAYKGETW